MSQAVEILERFIRRTGVPGAFAVQLGEAKDPLYIIVLPDMHYESALTMLRDLRASDRSGVLERTAIEGIGEVESLIELGVPDYVHRYRAAELEFLCGSNEQWERLRRLAQSDVPASEYIETLRTMTLSQLASCETRIDDLVDGLLQLICQHLQLSILMVGLDVDPPPNRQRLATMMSDPGGVLDESEDRAQADQLKRQFDRLYAMSQSPDLIEKLRLLTQTVLPHYESRLQREEPGGS